MNMIVLEKKSECWRRFTAFTLQRGFKFNCVLEAALLPPPQAAEDVSRCDKLYAASFSHALIKAARVNFSLTSKLKGHS